MQWLSRIILDTGHGGWILGKFKTPMNTTFVVVGGTLGEFHPRALRFHGQAIEEADKQFGLR